MRIKSCGLSDVGRSRSHNEDCFGIDAEQNIFVVADGMGGHGHGEVASRLAVRAIRDSLHESSSGNGDEESEEGLRGHSVRLKRAISDAHSRVVQAVEDDNALVGMGTTVVTFMLHDGVAAVAHVGDSRAYRFRDERLELVTVDHTWVNEQVVAGNLSEDQARSHPLKSVVTRAIGGDGGVEVDLCELDVRGGDLYLLCTDGLTTMLSDEEIRSSLAAGGSLEEICGQLVQEANQRGGLDNVTVVLLAVEQSEVAGEDEKTCIVPRTELAGLMPPTPPDGATG